MLRYDFGPTFPALLPRRQITGLSEKAGVNQTCSALFAQVLEEISVHVRVFGISEASPEQRPPGRRHPVLSSPRATSVLRQAWASSGVAFTLI